MINLKIMNREVFNLNLWVLSVGIFTVLCFMFDIYQLIVSDNKFLAFVSLACLVVGFASCIKWATDGFTIYFLVYLIPGILFALSIIPNGDLIGIDSGTFILSAYATAGSALLPPICTLITVPLVMILSYASKWVESYM